nr:alcohol dehydrogenase catalytic domain-containing protein [Burkholderia savannae]
MIGVNFVDTDFRSGPCPVASLPAVLGFEGAGVVEAAGGEVTRLRPGDRVAYTSAPIGAYAASRALPESRLVRIPDALSFETAQLDRESGRWSGAGNRYGVGCRP